MASSLNHELKEALNNQKSAAKPEVVEKKTFQKQDDVVSAEVPKVANGDQFINRSVGSAGGTLIKESVEKFGDGATGNMVQPVDELFTTDTVNLTKEERDDFLDCLISGKRYVQEFSIYGGRVTGKFRCRSTEESEAIASWLNICVREEKYKTPIDYALSIRNALLAAQVEELNGTKFDELKQPLYRTMSGEKTVDPAWVESANLWSKQLEPIVTGLYEALKLFERKYWTMVVHSGDQNFWNPAEST